MPSLSLPAAFPFPDMVTEIAAGDTMFQGSMEGYVSVGMSALGAIEAALEGRPTPGRILDFPCGYGRITRILRARFPNAAITVSDVDQDAVAFTSSRFRARGVLSSGDFRSLDLGGPFDLIWVGSLMTHLSEHMTRQLLDCLVRHMVPDTTLITSSHGRSVAERMQCYRLAPGVIQVVLRGYERDGYGYSDFHGSRNYGVSLVSRDWIDRTLDGSPLRLDSYFERAWDDDHDILVLRRVSQAGVDFQSAPPKGAARRVLSLARFLVPRPNSPGWFEARYTPRASLDEKDQDLPRYAQKVIEEFDEHWYLATYTDVATAVQRGHLRSALEHFKSHGWPEGRLPRAPQPDQGTGTRLR